MPGPRAPEIVLALPRSHTREDIDRQFAQLMEKHDPLQTELLYRRPYYVEMQAEVQEAYDALVNQLAATSLSSWRCTNIPETSATNPNSHPPIHNNDLSENGSTKTSEQSQVCEKGPAYRPKFGMKNIKQKNSQHGGWVRGTWIDFNAPVPTDVWLSSRKWAKERTNPAIERMSTSTYTNTIGKRRRDSSPRGSEQEEGCTNKRRKQQAC
ncbi:hypothetical protein P280DRAFT_516124 [Massarina eburnea CBS 473.64]|uniref:Uncharacterized protein n=1 Tax=Massarina eburnea CBS 473.64 TaxID=1395130 RepID=A0A6A6S421_9PLEO|nr:hypothetical protein P280DRAFT_516124 [Massarina eburnea CBS 473.64]